MQFITASQPLRNKCFHTLTVHQRKAQLLMEAGDVIMTEIFIIVTVVVIIIIIITLIFTIIIIIIIIINDKSLVLALSLHYLFMIQCITLNVMLL